MSINIKFNPVSYQMPADLQEKLKISSPVLQIKAVIPVYVVVNKGEIYYSGTNAISADDLDLYITRPQLMHLSDEAGKQLSEKEIAQLKKVSGVLAQLAAQLQADLETGQYDDQILEQREKAPKTKVLPEDISSGKLRPSPKNGTRLERVSGGGGSNVRDVVYNLIKNVKDDVTVGELTEMLDTEFGAQLEEKMPRNEVAKLVSSLKADSLVRPVRQRLCKVAEREVLAWTADMEAAPTEAVIKLARKRVEDARERYEQAQADYEDLIKQSKL